jgi:hypothetical protein
MVDTGKVGRYVNIGCNLDKTKMMKKVQYVAFWEVVAEQNQLVDIPYYERWVLFRKRYLVHCKYARQFLIDQLELNIVCRIHLSFEIKI